MFKFSLLILSISLPFFLTCPIFPTTNIWNTRIDTLPIHQLSNQYIQSIGPTRGLKADFGSGLWDGAPIGIPYNIINSSKISKSKVGFDYAAESDSGPYPIPSDYKIEGGANSSGDRHIIIVDNQTCTLYELYSAYPNNGTWTAGSGAIWNLSSNNLRPLDWTSADAAGLPIYPGLAKYEEVASGEIKHALRFTVQSSQKSYVWPARHFASSKTLTSLPPMGTRFRLKKSFNMTGFPKEIQVILTAIQQYGLILADNGSNWFISGAPHEKWDNDMLNTYMKKVIGSNLEAVDCSGLMKNINSGEAKQ